MNRLRQSLLRIFAFNRTSRDAWVREQAARIRPGSVVLDAGAGSCPYRSLFKHCRYSAHDFGKLRPEQLSNKRGYGRIDFVSDIAKIPVPNASFDVVVCTEVLEHVAEPILVLHEFSRILKPCGTVILTAPLGSGLHQEPYHFYGGYTPYWYKRFLEAADFRDVTIVPNGGFFEHFGQEGRRFADMLRAACHGSGVFTLLPLCLVAIPLFSYCLPVLCYLLRNIDSHKGFTVGYFVTAVRR